MVRFQYCALGTQCLVMLALMGVGAPIALAQKPGDTGQSGSAPSTQKSDKQTGHLDNISFKIPAGWKTEEPNPVTRALISPDMVESKQAMILLAITPPFEGEFRPAFEKLIAATLKGKKRVQDTEIQSSHTSEGYDVLQQVLVVEAGEGAHSFTHYIAVNFNGRIVLVCFIALSEETVKRYQTVWSTFLAQLDLPGKKKASSRHTGGIWAKSPQDIARDEDTRRKPETVSGAIYDAEGKPFHIPGSRVNIHIWGTSAEGKRTFYDTEMDANGRYSLRVPHGLYVVSANAYMPLNGKTLTISLDPLDGRPQNTTVDSTPGIVKDFGLKLWGPRPDGKQDSFAGYNGGGLYVTDGANWKEAVFGALERRYPQGSYVEVTLTPRSRLIDGSEGETLTLRCDLKRMQSGHTHPNIPLAVYTATARLIQPDGHSKRLKVALLPDLDYKDSIDVTYEPSKEDHEGRPVIPNLFVLD